MESLDLDPFQTRDDLNRGQIYTENREGTLLVFRRGLGALTVEVNVRSISGCDFSVENFTTDQTFIKNGYPVILQIFNEHN